MRELFVHCSLELSVQFTWHQVNVIWYVGVVQIFIFHIVTLYEISVSVFYAVLLDDGRRFVF